MSSLAAARAKRGGKESTPRPSPPIYQFRPNKEFVSRPESSLPFYKYFGAPFDENRYKPFCHCTIGYLPLLSERVMDQARWEAYGLIRKFFQESKLPSYVCKPHHVVGHDKLAGIARYKSCHLAKKMAGEWNSFPLMKYGKLACPKELPVVTGQFDYIHMNKNCPIVGSLQSDCNLYELASAMRNYLENEIYGQYDNPILGTDRHHWWSKFHITLSTCDWPWAVRRKVGVML